MLTTLEVTATDSFEPPAEQRGDIRAQDNLISAIANVLSFTLRDNFIVRVEEDIGHL